MIDVDKLSEELTYYRAVNKLSISELAAKIR